MGSFDSILWQCVTACDADDTFNRELFVSFAIGTPPGATRVSAKAIEFIAPIIRRQRSTEQCSTTDQSLLPPDLMQKLEEYNKERTGTEPELTRTMLPQAVEIANGRRVPEPSTSQAAIHWNLSAHTIAQHLRAVPVLVEWHCAYRRLQQTWYPFLQTPYPPQRLLKGRSLRVIMLMDKAEQAARQQGIDEHGVLMTIHKHSILSKLRLCIAGEDITGWICTDAVNDDQHENTLLQRRRCCRL